MSQQDNAGGGIQPELPSEPVPQSNTPRLPFRSTEFGLPRDSQPGSQDSSPRASQQNLNTPEDPLMPLNRTDPEVAKIIESFEALGLVGKKGAKIKIREPEVYDGKKRGTKADQFIDDCKLYFRVKKGDFLDRETKIIFAISYLTKTAKTWASPILRDLLGAQRKLESRNWLAFEAAFTKAFGDPDKEAAAVRELEALIQKGQKGLAVNYASDFRRITMEIGWDESTFIHYYRRGLKEEVKDALVYHPIPTDLDTLVNLSIRIDERIWERKQERTGDHPPRPTPHPQPQPQRNHNPFQQYQPFQSPPSFPSQPMQGFVRAHPNNVAPNAFNHNAPVPIHIDASRRGPVSADEKAK